MKTRIIGEFSNSLVNHNIQTIILDLFRIETNLVYTYAEILEV